MKKVACCFVVVLGCMALACTTVVVKEEPRGEEVFFPGEFIESVDANTISVKCQGKGYDMQAAILNARKGCVDWLINDQLAQTPGEKQAYRASQGQVFAKLDRYIGIPGPAARSGKGRGVKSRTRISDTEIQVKIIEHIQKKALMDDMVALGILQAKEQMLDAVGRPTLAVFPSKANKGKKSRKIMEDLVNSYLTKAKWEVLDAQGVQDLDKLVDAIGEVSGAEEDEAAQLAMAVGADVYIVFEANKKKKGAAVAFEVGINAFETTTGRRLAAETALSAERANWTATGESKAMMEGLNDAMGRVMPQISDYWKEDAPKGKKFYVVFNNAPKRTDMKMNGVLKKACSHVKLVTSTKATVKFQVQCKLDNLELSGAIDEGITAKMGGSAYDFAAKNRNNIIVVFE
jgi:hypothetical protein